jgi:hypothetical protein
VFEAADKTRMLARDRAARLVVKLNNLACLLQVQCHGCTYFDPVLSKMNPAVSAQQFSPDVAGAVLPSLSSSSSD